ncbi:sensor histidine kinase [Nonomuraea basaltis]|nr:sensor histidine kinase [Nonomuraea basaltis]
MVAWLRAHPYVLDGALALGMYLGVLMIPLFDQRFGKHSPAVPALVLGTLSCGALVFRRRAPRSVLVICVAATTAFLMLGGGRSPLDMPPALALFTVATLSRRRQAWIAGAMTAAALGGARLLFSGDTWLAPEVLAQIAWIGMATAAGDAIRTRRAYVAAVEERARRAEESREEEAERRVMQERLRIARELHDVLAHHIALINVQAQVAEHLIDREPWQARQALRHVRRAGKEALGELRTTVGLLRSPDSPEELPTEPSPGLDRLPGLVSTFTAAGLAVDLRLDGVTAPPFEPPNEPPNEPLPAPVELAAFRIVQEALTNVSKHAPAATAHVRVARTPDRLSVEVTDDGPGAVTLGTGHGLIGMRERALSLGGRFAAGPLTGGGFRVQAVLPLIQGAL